MVKIRFRNSTGDIREIEGGEGTTLKDAALQSEVAGIVGLCGGYANCATCHVYVDKEWLDRLPQVEEAEDIMLEGTICERTPHSRLACQLVLMPDLDGLTVTVPERQM
jgi:ferredoxin, 2Fe-2S